MPPYVAVLAMSLVFDSNFDQDPQIQWKLDLADTDLAVNLDL